MKATSGVLAIALMLLAWAPVLAESLHGTRRQSAKVPDRQRALDGVAAARRDLLRSAIEYKDELGGKLARQERVLRDAAVTADVRRDLREMGIVTSDQLAESERARVRAQQQVEHTRKRLTEAQTFITELLGRDQLAKLPSLAPGAFSSTPALIRFNGTARWSLDDLDKLQRFFASRFGRSLPVSALGQTAVHDRLGFDHRDAVDVALHPDSVEGKALMTHLQLAGIPFLAFRHAVPGSATGAHVHVGKPSLSW